MARKTSGKVHRWGVVGLQLAKVQTDFNFHVHHQSSPQESNLKKTFKSETNTEPPGTDGGNVADEIQVWRDFHTTK